MPNGKKDRFGKDLKIKIRNDRHGFQISDLDISRTGDPPAVANYLSWGIRNTAHY